MDERVKRMLKKGCPTEDIRLWGGMAHRVVELTGPIDAPEDLRIELFLHDESAFRLLDMCDAVDEKFEVVVAENGKLRDALAKALRIQSQYCDNMDAQYCKNECPLYRRETGDCDACDVISDAFDLGVYK